MSKEYYTEADIENFRTAQALAYDAVQAVAKRLVVGVTEKQAADMVEAELQARGITRYFHAPFAWFGARTAFEGIERPLDFRNFPSRFLPPHFGHKFMPTETQLQEGMAVILDVAPIYNDCAADIGYSFAFGRNEKVEKALDDLAIFRPLILAGVCKEKTMAEIYADVQEALQDLGYENCHAKYPQGVLGHKVGKIPTRLIPRIPVMRFEVSTFFYLAAEEVSRLVNPWDNRTALWGEHTRVSADPGLWAIEPHIGMVHGGTVVAGAKDGGTATLVHGGTVVAGAMDGGTATLLHGGTVVAGAMDGGTATLLHGGTVVAGAMDGGTATLLHGGTVVAGATDGAVDTQTFGVKWEELLHVTDNNAYYLDDNLPHVRRWTERQIAV